MKKAIFIDDDKGILDAVNMYATMKELPLTACLPSEARTKIESEKPQVVFFDYLMAGTDGPDLLKYLRTVTNIIFSAILVTAHPHIEAVAKAGFDGFVKKPFSFSELEKYVGE